MFTRMNRLPSGSEFFSMASPHTDMDNAIATSAHSLGYVLKPQQRTSIFQFASGSDILANRIWQVSMLYSSASGV